MINTIIPNYLNLPLDPYKLKGIETANLIFEALNKNQLTGTYSKSKQKLVIRHSHKISAAYLQKALYDHDYVLRYSYIYPVIDGRDVKGNWTVRLTFVKPQVDPYTYTKKFIEHFLGFPISLELKAAKKKLLRKYPFDAQEIHSMQAQIGLSIVKSMQDLMKPKQTQAGIWLWRDFESQHGSTTKFYRDQCESGYLDPHYFTKLKPYLFELLPDAKPSAAIEALFRGPSFLDCGCVIIACFYKTLLELVGEDKFDHYFSNNPWGKLRISIAPLSNNLISDFVRPSKQSKLPDEGSPSQRPLEVGDMCSFEGVKFYHFKHPDGSSGSWNTLYAGRNSEGKQVFVAQNFPKPLTEEEIYATFIRKYNLDQTPRDIEKLPYYQDRLEPFIKLFLTKFPKIDQKKLDQYGYHYFLNGYWHSITRRLKAEFVLALKTSDDIPGLQKDLALRQKFLSLRVIDGIRKTFINFP